MIKDLISKNQNYLQSLANETERMRYDLSYFDWQRIDPLKQFRLEEPIRNLSTDYFIKDGVHTFECNIVSPERYNDHYIVGIAEALRESQKAQKITLHFGQTRDSAMQYFLKAVEETKAPLQSIEIDTVRGVSDETWKLLPKIIRNKGVTIDVKNVRISDDIKERIEKANKSIRNANDSAVLKRESPSLEL